MIDYRSSRVVPIAQFILDDSIKGPVDLYVEFDFDGGTQWRVPTIRKIKIALAAVASAFISVSSFAWQMRDQ